MKQFIKNLYGDVLGYSRCPISNNTFLNENIAAYKDKDQGDNSTTSSIIIKKYADNIDQFFQESYLEIRTR